MDDDALDALTWAFIASAMLTLCIYGMVLLAQAERSAHHAPMLSRSPAAWIAFTA